jgi:methionyl-tRNA formyltransferase
MSKFSCILLTSNHEHLSAAAESFARTVFDVRHVSRYARDARHLEREVETACATGSVDFLLNFLSPVIVPQRIVRAVRCAAINFHPAPPEWPGVGSASYALYEEHETFGVTAHLMTEQIDGGPILRSTRFPILPDDNCESVFARALNFSMFLFYDLTVELARTGEARPNGETWARPAIRRADFERWMQVAPWDAPEEIRRKARALRHSRLPGPYVELAGMRFAVLPGSAPPRAARELDSMQEAA